MFNNSEDAFRFIVFNLIMKKKKKKLLRYRVELQKKMIVQKT